MSKKETVPNSDKNYNVSGRCPRCNHIIWREEQAGNCPPRHRCISCGWSDFDMSKYRDPWAREGRT